MNHLRKALGLGGWLVAACALFSQTPLNLTPTRVVGHPDLQVNTNQPNLIEGRELNGPRGVAIDAKNSPPALYVADTLNNRILAWRDANSFGNGAPADLVIGQKNKYQTRQLGPGTDLSSGLTFPAGIAVDDRGNLYAADSGNNRIVRYRKPFEQQGELVLADFVIGQPGLNSRTPNQGGLSARSLLLTAGNSPLISALTFSEDGSLYVADAGNHRVLRYPAGALAEGAPDQPDANLVLGQLDFRSSVPLPSSSDFRVRRDKGGMREPAGVALDQAGRLFVLDALNRVLVYRPPFNNGIQADRIMGVIDPSQVTAPVPAINETTIGLFVDPGRRLIPPEAIFTIGNIPFVVDTPAHRIMRFDPYDQWPREDVAFSPPAKAVIAQNAFRQESPQVNRGEADAGPQRLFSPAGAAFALNQTFVADTGNNRLLVFPNLSTGPPLAADVPYVAQRVLGQVGFEFRSPNLIEGREFHFASVFGSGAAIAIDGRSAPPRLYVADTLNNRVLAFADARRVRPGDRADLVIGQPDFFRSVSNYPAGQINIRNENGLLLPISLAVDRDGNLWVADQGNARVLRFPAPFSQQQRPLRADLVIGQSSFTAKVTDATSRTMNAPAGLAFTQEGLLLVSDSAHNRVLLFQPPFTTGMAALKVFGQPDTTSSQPGADNNQMNRPRHISTDTDDRLYVADQGNNRILIFDRVPVAPSNPRAVFILAQGLRAPASVAVSSLNGDIWVADTGGTRGVLRYPRFDRLPIEGDRQNYIIPSPNPLAVALDPFNNVLIADSFNRVALHFPRVMVQNAANGLFRVAPGMWTSAKTLDSLLNIDLHYAFTDQTAIGPTLPAIPKDLADIEVRVNDERMPVWYVSPFQINFLMANGAPSSGRVEVQISQASTGRIIAAESVPMDVASPAFFTAPGTGRGQIAAFNQDGSLNSSENQLPRGQVIQMYATGAGMIPNAPPDGAPAEGLVLTPDKPRVFVNLEEVPPDDVQYSGLAPGLPGVWQINVRVSERVPPNDNVVVLMFMKGIPSVDPQAQPPIRTTIAVK